MHQNRFRLGAAPDLSGEVNSVLPDPLAVFKGVYFLGEGIKGMTLPHISNGKICFFLLPNLIEKARN